MKLVIKALLLQAFWFLAILFGESHQSLIILSAFSLAWLNFFIYRPFVGGKTYFLFLVFFMIFGLFHDLSISWFGLISYESDQFPLWLTSLYIVFLCYYGDIFNYLSKLNWHLQFMIGASGGVSAYLGGAKLANFSILSPWFYFYVTTLWGIFFVISLKSFYRYEK